jgi:hypothetical protein
MPAILLITKAAAKTAIAIRESLTQRGMRVRAYRDILSMVGRVPSSGSRRRKSPGPWYS